MSQWKRCILERKDLRIPGNRRGAEIVETGYLFPLGALRILGLASAIFFPARLSQAFEKLQNCTAITKT
jgi:hypothetical protein